MRDPMNFQIKIAVFFLNLLMNIKRINQLNFQRGNSFSKACIGQHQMCSIWMVVSELEHWLYSIVVQELNPVTKLNGVLFLSCLCFIFLSQNFRIEDPIRKQFQMDYETLLCSLDKTMCVRHRKKITSFSNLLQLVCRTRSAWPIIISAIIYCKLYRKLICLTFVYSIKKKETKNKIITFIFLQKRNTVSFSL